MGWAFLLAALACGVGAYLVGWPAWTAFQARQVQDSNAERYRAWRGRGAQAGNVREGPTNAERRRLWLAGLLAGGALALLTAFFASG